MDIKDRGNKDMTKRDNNSKCLINKDKLNKDINKFRNNKNMDIKHRGNKDKKDRDNKNMDNKDRDDGDINNKDGQEHNKDKANKDTNDKDKDINNKDRDNKGMNNSRQGHNNRDVCLLVACSNVPATGWCISGTDLLRQFYMLPHWDRSCRSNFLPHTVTVYWHRANQSQRWPYNARRLVG